MTITKYLTHLLVYLFRSALTEAADTCNRQNLQLKKIFKQKSCQKAAATDQTRHQKFNAACFFCVLSKQRKLVK